MSHLILRVPLKNVKFETFHQGAHLRDAQHFRTTSAFAFYKYRKKKIN